MKAVFVLALIVFLALVTPALTALAWNASAVPLFGAHDMTWTNAFASLFLIAVLTGAIRVKGSAS